VGDAFLS
jgi:hypothetical protein